MMNGSYDSGSSNTFGDFDSSEAVSATRTYDLGYPDSNYAPENVEYVQHDTYPSFAPSTAGSGTVAVSSAADFGASYS